MRDQSAHNAKPLTSPLLTSLIRAVEEEEQVVDAIILCAEANDSVGVLRFARELMTLRRAVERS